MRTDDKGVVADHTLLVDVGPNDHHPQAESFTVLINSLSIPPGSYEKRISLATGGHQTIRVLLRGVVSIDIQGHVGVSAVGGSASANSTGVAISPYGGGGYLTSYMGAYSRLHGDSYLSQNGVFGIQIVFQDVYVDDDEAVLVFYNTHPTTNQNLTVYGTGVVK